MNASIDLSPLHSLRFAKFSLLLEATEELHLPEYKGSTFRGSFGVALKKAAEAMALRGVYDLIFEPKIEKSVADLLRIGRDAPQPFVLVPPLSGQPQYRKGESFTAELTLVGTAISYLPLFVASFSSLRVGRHNVRLRLVRITDSDKLNVYDDATQKLNSSVKILNASDIFGEHVGAGINVPPASEETPMAIHLSFLTPIRIKSSFKTGERQLLTSLESNDDVHTFLESLYHRLFILSQLYCSNTVEHYHPANVLHGIRDAKLLKPRTTWNDWERISNRQKVTMNLGGFVNEASLQIPGADILQLLRLGEFLHVGKQASFGLGKYELTIL